MNVAMLVLNSFTHDARVHKEAKTLAAAGYDVTVIALWEAGLPEQEQAHGYRIVRLALRSRPWQGGLCAPLIKYLEFSIRVWRWIGHEPVQVVHAHAANVLPAAWLASRRADASMIYDAHELETGRNFGNFRLSSVYRRLWAWLERAFIRQADAVLTVGDSIADELVQLYGIRRPTVVMNCPEWQKPTPSTRLRDELGIPMDQKVVLYQGMVAAGRGIEAFVEAVQQVPNAAAVILGDGPLLPDLRTRAASGALPRVYLPGRVPLAELAEYTASADVGVSLIQATCRSYELSLPNKLFEYVQAGLPVVGSDLPEIERVIATYGLGEVVDPENPQTIAGALRRLLEDEERYSQSRANARSAASVLNWETESRKLVELYRDHGR